MTIIGAWFDFYLSWYWICWDRAIWILPANFIPDQVQLVKVLWELYNLRSGIQDLIYGIILRLNLTVRFLFSDTNQRRRIQGGNVLLMLSRNNLEDLWQAVMIISWWRVNLRYRTLIPIKSIIFMFKSFWFLRIFLYICSMSMDQLLYLWCTYRCSEV